MENRSPRNDQRERNEPRAGAEFDDDESELESEEMAGSEDDEDEELDDRLRMNEAR